MFIRCLLICIALFIFFPTSVFAVGYRVIEEEGLKVSVWYPSEAEEQEIRFGPFDARFAVDAVPTPGKYQPILLSHGNGGRVRNHYLSAKALADAGFVVVAPLHTADHLIDTDSRAKAVNWRARELLIALELVMRDNVFNGILDISRIHGLGYSLGALTIMQAAGTTIDLTAVDEHCANNEDIEFCEKASWFLRQKIRRIRNVDINSAMREMPRVFTTFPYINGNIALIAPVGQGAIIDRNYFQANKVFIVALKDDVITLPRFHAKYLESIVPAELLYESLLSPGNHHAFIAPFSERVTSKEDIPAAKDPEGFDRPTFLSDLNVKLQEFYGCCH